jgi:hypothetical protein
VPGVHAGCVSVVAEVIDVFRMRRDAKPSRRQLVTLIIIIASAVCVALAGRRDAEIAAAIKSGVEAKKAVGMVVATIEPDGSSSFAAFGNAGPGARPLRRFGVRNRIDYESVYRHSAGGHGGSRRGEARRSGRDVFARGCPHPGAQRPEDYAPRPFDAIVRLAENA